MFLEQEIRLLLVGSNLSYVEVTKKMLVYHEGSYVVEVATTGEECFDKLLHQKYQLVLLDFDVDDRQGLFVLNKIIQSGLEIPVVMLVEEGREDIAFKALERGAADYIMKVRGYLTALPFTVGRVLDRQNWQKKKDLKPITAPDSPSADMSIEREEAYYILDRRGRFISTNKKLETMLDYSEEELLELTLLDLIPREKESEYNQWISTLDFGYNNKALITELIGKYGSRKQVEIFITPARNQDGEITGYKGKLSAIRSMDHNEFPSNGYFNQTRMIREMVDIIHSSYDDSFNHLLERITKSVCQIFQFKRATLALLDRRRQVFVKQTMIGYDHSNNFKDQIIEVPQDLIMRIFDDQYKIKVMYFDQNTNKQPNPSLLTINERRTQPRRPDQKWHPKDMVILKLLDQNNQTFGYISLDNPDLEKSPPREVFYNLELFGNLASLAIENYYRLASVEKKNRRLKQLLVTSNIFKLHLSLNEMLNEIVWSVKFSLDFNLVLLGLISKKSGKLEIKSVACDDKIKAVQMKEMKFKIESFRELFKKQYRKSKSYFINQTEPALKNLKDIYYHTKHQAYGDRYWHWWAFLIVPIRSKEDKIIGFLMVDDPADCMTPTAETIHTLEILGSQIAIAIDNRITYLQLKEKISPQETSDEKGIFDANGGVRRWMDKLFK